MMSQQKESLSHGNITEDELNRAPLNFLKNITAQKNHQQQQGLNDQLNDPNLFLHNNVLHHQQHHQQQQLYQLSSLLNNKGKKQIDIRQKRYSDARIKARNSLTNIAYLSWTRKIVTTKNLLAISTFCLHKIWIRFCWKNFSIIHTTSELLTSYGKDIFLKNFTDLSPGRMCWWTFNSLDLDFTKVEKIVIPYLTNLENFNRTFRVFSEVKADLSVSLQYTTWEVFCFEC